MCNSSRAGAAASARGERTVSPGWHAAPRASCHLGLLRPTPNARVTDGKQVLETPFGAPQVARSNSLC